MQADMERTLGNLHVIGAIAHNDKLMTNDNAFNIYTPTTIRGFVRTWYSEGRDQNMVRIRSTVHGGIDFSKGMLTDIRHYPTSNLSDDDVVSVNTLRKETMERQFRRMVDALRRAGKGLTNLTHTYRDDAALCSQIWTTVEEISDFVEVISRNAGSSPPMVLLRTPSCASLDAASDVERRIQRW